ncbi:MAG: DNA primase [Bacteroidia bacterium]
MILKSTIEKVVESSRIDEVVGDFVQLKKRGANLLGVCPFHNEKTPSFTVSPSKGIYKCFGCGKAGDSIGFIMEHEHYSYPEAIKYLAKKYHIEIEETVQTDEDKIAESERESLYVVSSFAQKFYTDYLHLTEEGKSIGKSYFIERGFTEATIEKFQLGFAPTEWSKFTDTALQNQFKLTHLEKTGLTIVKENKQYDRFRGRVMFPIHNLTGRVIAFGARILKTEPNSPKYVNSPESDIYSKSKILYGIYFAKKTITQNDECFLCEGYTDVISLHQAGIENAVASSGTSLTVEQIKLIGRYTKNVTVLYDGDAAGIKASLRGIDLILEEGLNVRVVLFPDGDDPDSFSKKVSTSELKDFLKANSKDFMLFKTSLLLSDVGNDPIGKAKLIRDIVESIAKIPDAIIRSTYTKQCANLMEISEQVLISEVNKIRRKDFNKKTEEEVAQDYFEEILQPDQQEIIQDGSFFQEQEIIRLLLNFSDNEILISEGESEREGEGEKQTAHVKNFMKNELEMDGIKFENELFANIFAAYDNFEDDNKSNQQYFLQHENPEIRNKVGELISERYELSEHWQERGILVPPKDFDVRKSVIDAIYHLKKKCIMKMIVDKDHEIKTAFETNNDYEQLMEDKKSLLDLGKQINSFFGTVISH